MRGIIFDLDDTLYPRADFMRSGFDAVACYVSHSWRLDRHDVLATLMAAHADGRRGREFQAICEEHRLPQSAVAALVTVFRKHRPSIALAADTRRVLVQLRDDGWRLAVLTNGAPGVQRRKAAALGIDGLVEAVIYAEEHAPGGKPDRAAFQAALDCLRLPAYRCICVGDDPLCDIEGAGRLGMRTIRVAAPSDRKPVRDADAVVASLPDVPACARALLSENVDAA